MQSLDVHDPDLPDLQFVLIVAALCTCDLPSLNVPESLRREIFDRCWVLLHDSPPPSKPEDRKLDLRQGTELTLEAMVQTIRATLSGAGITRLTWDHPPSEPRHSSTPAAEPLIDRLQKLYPAPPDPVDLPPRAED